MTVLFLILACSLLFIDVRTSHQAMAQLQPGDFDLAAKLRCNGRASLLNSVLAWIAVLLPDHSPYVTLCTCGMALIEAVIWNLDYRVKVELNKRHADG